MRRTDALSTTVCDEMFLSLEKMPIETVLEDWESNVAADTEEDENYEQIVL